MNYLDIVILLVCGVAFLLGFKDGFVRKIIGTVGFFLAVFLAIRFSPFGGSIVHKVAGIEPEFAQVLGGFVIFILCIVGTSLVKRLIHPFDKVNNMINRIVGGMAGVLQILIFLSALFYLTNVFKFPSEKDRANSFCFPTVQSVLPKTIHLIHSVTPKSKDSIKKMIEKDTI